MLSPTFLNVGALITLALIFHFHQDDHPTLIDAMARVEISTYFFQVALGDSRVMLPKVI